MATYQILKSDGTFLTMIEDTEINTTSTSINLFGQGISNYGNALDENLVYMLENFSNIVSPVNPLVGQLWYNKISSTLNYYGPNSNNNYVWFPLVNSINPLFTGNIIVSDGEGDQSELTNNGILILTNTTTPKIELQYSLSGPVISTIKLNGNDIEITSNAIFDQNILCDFYSFKSQPTSGMQYVSSQSIDSGEEFINLLFDNDVSVSFTKHGQMFLTDNTSSGTNSASIVFSTAGQIITPYLVNSLNLQTTGDVTNGALYVNGNKVYTTVNFNPNQFVPIAGGTMTGTLIIDSPTTELLEFRNTALTQVRIDHILDDELYSIVINTSAAGSYYVPHPLWIDYATGGVFMGVSLDVPSISFGNYGEMNSQNGLLNITVNGELQSGIDEYGNMYTNSAFVIGTSNAVATNVGIANTTPGQIELFVPNTAGNGNVYPLVCNNSVITANVNFVAPNLYLNNNWGFGPISGGGINILAGSTVIGEINSSYALTMNGDITAFSDERLKSNIKTSKGLDIVTKLRGTTYIKDGKLSHGVIAQEVQKVIPEAIGESQGYLTVNYNQIIPHLIEAIKELSDKIDKLESK